MIIICWISCFAGALSPALYLHLDHCTYVQSLDKESCLWPWLLCVPWALWESGIIDFTSFITLAWDIFQVACICLGCISLNICTLEHGHHSWGLLKARALWFVSVLSYKGTWLEQNIEHAFRENQKDCSIATQNPSKPIRLVEVKLYSSAGTEDTVMSQHALHSMNSVHCLLFHSWSFWYIRINISTDVGVG